MEIANYEVLSLFSGAMGLDIGLESAGLEVAACVERDRWCRETITANRPDVVLLGGDVSEVSGQMVCQQTKVNPSRLIIAGGPPCQSFSSGGKRAALNDPRGNLVLEYFRLVNELRPAAFIFENVGNILTATLRHRPIEERPGKHWNLARYSREDVGGCEEFPALEEDELSGSAFKYLLGEIMSLDYSVIFGVLNAADYGSPQKRIRFCMLGYRDVAHDGLPPATHGDQPHFLPHVTLRDAIPDLIESPGQHSVYTDKIRYFFERIPPGGNWRDLCEEDQRKALGKSFASGGGKTGFMRRLSWDRPAPTLTTKANRKGTALCHPEILRPLSVLEYMRIQGFPDSWVVSGAMNQKYQQIGNAVPVPLGKALGSHVLATLRKGVARSRPVELDLQQVYRSSLKKLRSYARNTVRSSSKQPILL